MWHPPERIRHTPSSAGTPSAEEAACSRLFSPLSVGRLHLADRTWVPAMVPWRATDEGFVTEDVLQWYERFAKGQPGAIVVEATGVRDIPSGPLLRIGDDRFLPGLRQLVDTVRRASAGRTQLFIQIIDFLSIRRRPTRETFLGRYLQLTDRHRLALTSPNWGQSPLPGTVPELGDSPQTHPGTVPELGDSPRTRGQSPNSPRRGTRRCGRRCSGFRTSSCG